jgi:hypothetical protein
MELGVVPENIELVAADFAWTFPELDVSSNQWQAGFPWFSATTTYTTRTRPISNINGTKELRVKPDGSCAWLWNDVRAVSTTFKDGLSVTDRYIDEVIYEPLNAIDATNPWDRVILPNTDTRCGYSRVTCLTGIDAATYVNFIPINIATPNTIGLSAGWHWRLEVRVKIARTAIAGNAVLGYVPGLAGGDGSKIWYVTPVNYNIRTAYPDNPFDATSSATSVPPYKYEKVTRFPPGGLLAVYYAPIDCVDDFDGIPFTLTRNLLSGDWAADFDATVPDTVQITI